MPCALVVSMHGVWREEALDLILLIFLQTSYSRIKGNKLLTRNTSVEKAYYRPVRQ